MKADELWEKYQSYRTAESAMSKHAFLAALHEYGALVRARDAEMTQEAIAYVQFQSQDCYKLASYLNSTISKEPLP